MTQQWKPIESAPKDGTEILVWRSDCGQFIASYTSADAFPMTQDELDAWDEETLFTKDWFTQGPYATRLEDSEVPTLWQPLPTDPCQTCNDQGAVGNILTAQPCPDCSPPASAQDDAKDDQPVAKVRRGHYGGRVGNIGFQEAVLLPGVKVMDNTLLYARPAPAAGDARDAARYRWLKERNGGPIGIVAWHRDEEQEMVLVDDHADAAIDAAIAASQQQEG